MGFRGLDPARASIKQPHAKSVFELGDRLRHGGLSDAQLQGFVIRCADEITPAFTERHRSSVAVDIPRGLRDAEGR